ncbi:WD40 repeat domain-containing protein [Streptomyces scopuliridis]|uniref:WD40 repeat domain-containing protein n=1 Tax=Streptomyces scopuliridis TaxID=452529 RepID=UPI0036A4DA0E
MSTVPRGEMPLAAGDGALLRFAADLRRLRDEAGKPAYRILSARAHYSIATLSGAAAGRRLPTLAVTLAYARACGGDETRWARRWHDVAAELAAELAAESAADEDEAGAGKPTEAPYVGLAAFRPDDSQWFFGREALVGEVMTRLAAQRFLAVFGASGSGKSSLLGAGLLARLRAENDRCQVITLTPGPHPLEETAIRLAFPARSTAARLYTEFTADPGNLHRTVRQIALQLGGDGEVVLVVDQFEEVFTVCRGQEERSGFIAALIAAARAPNSRCRVVIAVRTDFYPHCAEYAELAAALRDAQITVGPMSADELHRAIVRPAGQAGCRVEGTLLTALTAQAQGQVAVLPLLSHALLETWRRRRGNVLTLTGFQAAGGIEGSLAQTAEAFYAALDPGRQAIARHLFLRLTALGEGTEDTKRRITRGELDADEDTAAVLERAVAVRLITLDGGRLEVTHEALIRGWPRLRRWLTHDRERLRAHRRLTEAAEAWESLNRDPGALYRGTRLAMARQLARGGDDGLTLRESTFLNAGLAAEAAETTTALRRARRLRMLVTLLAVLLTLTTATTLYAVRANEEVTRQRNSAVASNAAEGATELLHKDPALAVQIGLAAHRLAPTGHTRDSLVSTLMPSWVGHHGELVSLAIGPDGTVLATAGGDRTVRLWDIGDPRRPVQLSTLGGQGTFVRSVAMRRDGKILATAGDDRKVRLWDVAAPKRPTLLATLDGHTGAVRALAFSSDGRTLASSGGDRTVRLWNTGDPEHPTSRATLGGHLDTVRAVALSPDGRTLATAAEDETVRLWDTSGPGRPTGLSRWRAHRIAALWVAFSPRGDVLATAGGGDSAVRLWDIADRGHPRELSALTGHSDVVGEVAFSPDGRALATGSDDRTVRLWDVTDPRRPAARATLTGYTTAVGALRFDPYGRTVVSGGYDGVIRVLPVDFDPLVARACAAAHPTITRAAWDRYLPGVAYRPPCP